MIAPAPVKSISFAALNAFDVDITLGKNIQIILGKILADHTDDPHRGKKAGAESEIRRRTAENALGRAERGFDGVKSNGADNQDTHRYFPMIGFNSARNFLGIRDRSVMIASFSAEAQAQERAWVSSAAARRIVRWARSTLFLSTVKTCSISTSPAPSFQQS